MFSPVESQIVFLSKETPTVSVGLRTAMAILSNLTFCHISKTCNQFYSKSHVNQLVLNTRISGTHVHIHLNI